MLLNTSVKKTPRSIFLKSFTKIQRSGTPSLFKLLLCQAYPILRKKTAGVLGKIVTEMAKLHTAAIAMKLYCYVRGSLNYKPGGF